MVIQGDPSYIAFCHLKITGTFCQSSVHGSYLRAKSLSKVFQAGSHRKSVLRERTLGSSVYDLEEKLSHGCIDGVTDKVCIQRL